ncbi:MAG: FAD-binding protein [Clostridia bacterium]|nr:FAD-binding protein [Clostridia bacterium]
MTTYVLDAIVIGTGAAGYNAACRLKEMGVNVAIVTEGVNCGTSRNTGSDKQTYYKLGLGGDSPDSVRQMAENLFAGGCVDGDNALCEAALSVRSFMNLCELGVEFPVNRYGEYVGYKTDHDPYARATSAGPLTSKFMTEALQNKANQLGIKIFNDYLAVEILKNDGAVCGLLCINVNDGSPVAFSCGNVVMATGGPAGIYADSVYPQCHTGTTSLALLAGAKAQNLTMWQYGLASVNPRWNVSGTYMQVLPRFVSVDKEGNEYEFLTDYLGDAYTALSLVFLKGYQWPFDPKKAEKGSSQIDMIVYNECVVKGRKVYLDFTKNPFGLENIDYERLSDEARDYLVKAEATFGTPIERLAKMNTPAIELYSSKGVDITKEYLEIALCAQHNNGGIAVDMWWQTSVRGLFAAGECAGTHGISRPGGSALNAGQVGSLRAAQYIAQNPNAKTNSEDFRQIAIKAAKSVVKPTRAVDDNLDGLILAAQRRMSDNAAAVRDKDKIKIALDETVKEIAKLETNALPSSRKRVFLYYKLKDILFTQSAVITAMLNEDISDTSKIQEVYLTDDGFVYEMRDVRPLPDSDDFFENIWRTYRENKNVY